MNSAVTVQHVGFVSLGVFGVCLGTKLVLFMRNS